MEVELSLDLINSCNYARKRQAALESCTEIIQSKKRPCLEDFSWHTENTSNLETENRLVSCTQPMVEVNQLHDHNQPFSDQHSATHSHMDINCNIVYEVNDTQQMDISHDSAISRSQIPALLVQGHSSSVSCVRCLRGEPGHINHLSS
ncbi:hypothetical protein ACROYT_G034569 [Oculina patagonica]